MSKQINKKEALDRLIEDLDVNDKGVLNRKYQEAKKLIKNAQSNRDVVYNNTGSKKLYYYTLTAKFTARTDSPFITADCIGADTYEMLDKMHSIQHVDVTSDDVCGRIDRASGGMSEMAAEEDKKFFGDEGMSEEDYVK